MPRKVLNRVYFAIAAFALLALLGFVLEAWRWPTTGVYWHVAPLVGSIIIAAGWIVASENTVRNNARQHTIAVILNYKSDASDKRWDIINAYLPNPAVVGPLSRSIESKMEQTELYDAIDAELNACEFIALGVLKEVLDQDMSKSSFRQDFLALYDLAEPYIDYTTANRGCDIWNNFCQICSAWRDVHGLPGPPLDI